MLRNDKAFLTDGFLALEASGQWNALRKSANIEKEEMNEWLLIADQWRLKQFDAASDFNDACFILCELWEHLSNQLIFLLQRAHSHLGNKFPEYGWLLVYLTGLEKLAIVKYEFFEAMPKFNIIQMLDNPKSLLDVSEYFATTEFRYHSDMKEMMSSGHKFIVHRGVLIHVDQRVDIDVFGPSIDTLLMSEIMAQTIFEADNKLPKQYLEIGCGNGLLTAQFITHAPPNSDVFSLDSHFPSLACAHRNASSIAASSHERLVNLTFICGKFQSDLLNRNFDFVVCNPPYIPLPPRFSAPDSRVPDYFRAVGGIDLLTNVIASAPSLLAGGGGLLVLASNLSLEHALTCVPADYKVERPLGDLGYEVRFDVEAVLRNSEWLDYLLEKCGLIERSGEFFHTLHPLRIDRPIWRYAGEEF